MKIALLSNINMNGTIRYLQREVEVYNTEGYGNELGILMNPLSSLHSYAPKIIFVINDLMELLNHNICEGTVSEKIEAWFKQIELVIKSDVIYYVADAYLYGKEIEVLNDYSTKLRVEYLWQCKLQQLVEKHDNVRIFPYRCIVEKCGETDAFSMKTWYMGKILHSSILQQNIAEKIIYLTNLETKIPKKVLALDLDNTLWGGLAGENDITPIILSDDHVGLAYKNLQRVILKMKEQGVILVIVSKNNENDALNIIENHPHMILRLNDFSNIKINWNNKTENLQIISQELNVGLDSIVFFDDNPTERQMISDILPEVIVSDFPGEPENLPDSMIAIWNEYFSKTVVTEDDKNKTLQYKQNAQRERFRQSVVSFEEYLQGLNIVLTRKATNVNLDRIAQLLNKTNQFNLTTKRHTINDIQDIAIDERRKIFVYQASDKFGDYGVVAVAITCIDEDSLTIEEFVMSCRIMGKNIENAIIDDIETWAVRKGCNHIRGLYIESKKNEPVKNLYSSLGYIKNKQSIPEVYELDLNNKESRQYCLSMCMEEE